MADKRSDILSFNNEHLALFHDREIVVDKELPKYSLIKKEVENFKNHQFEEEDGGEPMSEDQAVEAEYVSRSFKKKDAIKELIRNYEKIRDGNIRQVNIFINKYMFNDIFSSFNMYKMTNNLITADGAIPFEGESGDNSSKKKKKKHNIFRKLSDIIKSKIKEAEDIYAIDVLEFFSQVKGLTKSNKDAYVNRLCGYIVALKNCDSSGQTALKEQLVRDMVINKYESVLYANDMYYVVTEDQVVNFVKKTEKGVRLTYVKNYMRIIPPEVVSKINETNKMEIFDNYVILHYDPECKGFAETIEETKKRRDPILFGVIKGSKKLYYVTDWIDEFCDLTLDKFVETLQTSKDALKMPAVIDITKK